MPHRRIAGMLVAFVLSLVGVSVAGVVYTGLSVQENNRQWCELLVPLNRAYSSTPPATDLGKQVALAIERLTTRFGCDSD